MQYPSVKREDITICAWYCTGKLSAQMCQPVWIHRDLFFSASCNVCHNSDSTISNLHHHTEKNKNQCYMYIDMGMYLAHITWRVMYFNTTALFQITFNEETYLYNFLSHVHLPKYYYYLTIFLCFSVAAFTKFSIPANFQSSLYMYMYFMNTFKHRNYIYCKWLLERYCGTL